jgi:hypothetical protein
VIIFSNSGDFSFTNNSKVVILAIEAVSVIGNEYRLIFAFLQKLS